MQTFEIRNRTMLDLIDIFKDVVKGDAAARYGSWADRNPLAGKMRTCSYCKTRRREGMRNVTPCCNAALVKPLFGMLGSPAVEKKPTLHQLIGTPVRNNFSAKRKKPHRSSKALLISEWRKKFEDETPCILWRNTKTIGERLMVMVQIEMSGAEGRHTPSVLLGKAAAGSLAEQYVAFMAKAESKAARERQAASRTINLKRQTRRKHAKRLHMEQNGIRKFTNRVMYYAAHDMYEDLGPAIGQ